MINTNSAVLPPQMLPLSKKNKEWKKQCMDALESIGKLQFNNNATLSENYEMVRGKFIYSHYVEKGDYADLVDTLTKEFELPSYLRHYDIISQVINTMSGEYQKRPDIFRVKSHDENTQNTFLRKKTELLLQYVTEQITANIDAKLAEEGLNNPPQPGQEEAQQQAVEERKRALTPPEIEKYMSSNWMDAAEIWAQHQIEFDKQRFTLTEKEKTEFEDMLIADRCFRHFYLTPNDYNQETWNPINTFYHKSPEIEHIENGDYVGRVFYLTISEIINRYGHKMTKNEILTLEKNKRESYKSGNSTPSYSGLTPGQVVPFQDYGDYRMVKDHIGIDPNNPQVEMDILAALGESRAYSRSELFQVTEAYWMSQRKIGKYVYPNEAGVPQVMLVDETFDTKLLDVEEIENSFFEFGEDERVNTITWTWVNQVWKGLKINNTFSNMEDPLYIDVNPNEFQFKGDTNIYGAKLPVCGQIFNARNSDSMSLVDLMKPHQIGYNVAMNQLYEIMQREIGRFILMDINVMPSDKDWGGPRNYERFMTVAKQLGIGPVDASPSNKHQTDFSHFQQIDLDESSRMLSRLKIAEAFEIFALKQVGITPQRLGSTSPSESATGVQQAVNQSYAQTESYFTNFSHFKRRTLQMGLEMAQYVQSHKENVTLSYTKSDLSRAFIKIAGTDLILSEFGVFVSSSQEAARQLEMLRQFALENNTAGTSPADIATIITSNSPSEIKTQLEKSWKEQQAQQDAQRAHEQEIAQKNQETELQKEQMKLEHESKENELDRLNDLEVAKVRGMGYTKNTDVDSNGIPDILEIKKFENDKEVKMEQIASKERIEEAKIKQEDSKISLEKSKMKQEAEIKEKERQLKEKEIAKKNAKG